MQRSTTSYSTQDSTYKSFQPKFKECVFNSDKEAATYFLVWVRLLSGIIRASSGTSLEALRSKISSTTTSRGIVLPHRLDQHSWMTMTWILATMAMGMKKDYWLKVLGEMKKSRTKGIMRLKGLQLSHISFDSQKVLKNI